jgi:hypothetical protein
MIDKTTARLLELWMHGAFTHRWDGKQIVRCRTANLSDVAKCLNREGHRTKRGNRWHPQSVKDVLSRELGDQAIKEAFVERRRFTTAKGMQEWIVELFEKEKDFDTLARVLRDETNDPRWTAAEIERWLLRAKMIEPVYMLIVCEKCGGGWNIPLTSASTLLPSRRPEHGCCPAYSPV